MNWPTKFELNPISVSANTQKLLDQLEARKCQEFSRAGLTLVSLGSTIMNVSIKFQFNHLSGFFGNVWQPQKV